MDKYTNKIISEAELTVVKFPEEIEALHFNITNVEYAEIFNLVNDM